MSNIGIPSGISCKVGFNDNLNLNIDFPINNYLNFNENNLESYAKDCLSKISPSKQFSINELNIIYSEIEATPYSIYNTIIEVNIPYVLHIPNNYELNIKTPQETKVYISKIWTNKAKESYNFDCVADDNILYYKDGTFITPKIPQESSIGWKWNAPELKNVEEIYQTGDFRYSKLKIHFNNIYSIDDLKSNKFNDEYLPNLSNFCLDIVNKIISTYRNNFKDYSLNLLNYVEIMSIYFPRYGFGYYPLGINIKDATINREKSKIKDFLINLKSEKGIIIYDMLLDNAKSTLLNRDFKKVIIESFTATDIFVESFINQELIKIGKSLKDIGVDGKKIFWSTKIGLNNGCKLLYGKEFIETNKDIYSIYNKYYRIRNKVIHKGYSPNYEEAISCIESNENIINLLKTKFTN